MNSIYQDKNYTLAVENDRAVLSNGTKQQTLPLRHGVDEIPTGLAGALKKAGQKPDDYFCVAGRYVLRRAALPAWTAAVDARIVERHAEKAAADAALAADIAARGQRALVLHSSYLMDASLVYVRPMDEAEAAIFRQDLQATGKVAMGDWTRITPAVAQAFLAGLPLSRRNDGWVDGQESVVILITEQEWNTLLAGDTAALDAEKAEKSAKAAAEVSRIEAARHQAKQTGEPVEIDRAMDECDRSVEDCSFDLVRRMILGDGTRFTLRTHCH